MRGLPLVVSLFVVATACGASTGGADPGSSEPDVAEGSVTDPQTGPDLANPPGVTAVVSRVVDGDTFEARLGGETVDVRLIGIDAPESVIPGEPVECFGPEASAFTERRLERKEVLLEFDVERIDTFGRTLAYAWTGRRLFNEDLVRKGFATVATYPPNVAHVERLVEAEKKARRDGLGLWDACLLPINTGADWRELGDV
jgi:micrococcal nuclease